MIFESLFHLMYSWTITSIMPTFILETSWEGHLYVDTNHNQLRQRKVLHQGFYGADCGESTFLAGMGRGNLESYCYRAQRRGMKSDYFIFNCISSVHSFTLYGRLLCNDWEGLLEGGCTSLAVPYPTGWGTDCLRSEHSTGAREIQRGKHYGGSS